MERNDDAVVEISLSEVATCIILALYCNRTELLSNIVSFEAFKKVPLSLFRPSSFALAINSRKILFWFSLNKV